MYNIRIPKPYCLNRENVKAFVLGADPTNFSKNRKRVELTTVFGIGDGDKRYFAGILKNLTIIGLSQETVYVQNLVGEYLERETEMNKEWEAVARNWLPSRVKEFNDIDPTRKIPVLVTAERILNYLLNDKRHPKPFKYYNCEIEVPIKNELNKLERPLIPFYRHFYYSLVNSAWGNYKMRLIQIFKI